MGISGRRVVLNSEVEIGRLGEQMRGSGMGWHLTCLMNCNCYWPWFSGEVKPPGKQLNCQN